MTGHPQTFLRLCAADWSFGNALTVTPQRSNAFAASLIAATCASAASLITATNGGTVQKTDAMLSGCWLSLGIGTYQIQCVQTFEWRTPWLNSTHIRVLIFNVMVGVELN